jgi:hypothetical protein
VSPREAETSKFKLLLQDLDQRIHTKLNLQSTDSETHQLNLYREDEDKNEILQPQEALSLSQ